MGATRRRRSAARRIGLKLDGAMLGFPEAVEGGGEFADVVTVWDLVSYYGSKHVGTVRYEDIVLETGQNLHSDYYDWINASWGARPLAKNGSVVRLDENSRVIDEREFHRALLTSVTIPALDAASKDEARLTVRLSPEMTRLKQGSGARLTSTIPRAPAWRAAHFRLEVDGLDTTTVVRIESFTVRRPAIEYRSGGDPLIRKLPGRLEIPNLEIRLQEWAAAEWYAWFDDFVMSGNSGPGNEKNGTLTLLAPNLKKEFGHVALFNLGICGISPVPARSDLDLARLVRVVLYCERMELHVPGA